MENEPNLGWKDVLGEHATNPPLPRSNGYPIYAFDNEYKASPVENRIKAQFEDWVQSNVLRNLNNLENREHPDSVRKYREAYVSDLAVGRYNWDGDVSIDAAGSAVRASLTDIPGMMMLFFLLLKRCQKDMTKEQSDKIFRASANQALLCLAWALGNEPAPQNTGAPILRVEKEKDKATE